MQCKIFSVPVDSERALDQEQRLNDFLRATNVKRIFASIANQPGGSTWSVLFFYDGEASTALRGDAVAANAVESGHPVAALKTTVEPGSPLSAAQVKGIIALKKWRAEQAAQENVPLYMVAQNRWLEEIVRMPVHTLEELAKVAGLGEWRVKKYGGKIVEIMNAMNAAKRSYQAPPYSAAHA